jgi:hypothetical protein
MNNARKKIRIILLLDPIRFRRLKALNQKMGENRQYVLRKALDVLAEKEGVA